MKNKEFGLMVVSISFGIVCLIAALLFMTIAKDLNKKVGILEQQVTDYKWQIEQVPYICMGGEHE